MILRLNCLVACLLVFVCPSAEAGIYATGALPGSATAQVSRGGFALSRGISAVSGTAQLMWPAENVVIFSPGSAGMSLVPEAQEGPEVAGPGTYARGLNLMPWSPSKAKDLRGLGALSLEKRKALAWYYLRYPSFDYNDLANLQSLRRVLFPRLKDGALIAALDLRGLWKDRLITDEELAELFRGVVQADWAIPILDKAKAGDSKDGRTELANMLALAGGAVSSEDQTKALQQGRPVERNLALAALAQKKTLSAEEHKLLMDEIAQLVPGNGFEEGVSRALAAHLDDPALAEKMGALLKRCPLKEHRHLGSQIQNSPEYGRLAEGMTLAELEKELTGTDQSLMTLVAAQSLALRSSKDLEAARLHTALAVAHPHNRVRWRLALGIGSKFYNECSHSDEASSAWRNAACPAFEGALAKDLLDPDTGVRAGAWASTNGYAHYLQAKGRALPAEMKDALLKSYGMGTGKGDRHNRIYMLAGFMQDSDIHALVTQATHDADPGLAKMAADKLKKYEQSKGAKP